jgi:threonine ammonia-lyase medium form
MISFADIQRAAETLRPVVHRTPVLSSRTFNQQVGNEVYFKAENFQRIGAFKFRGAYNTIASLSEAERARGVVAHSSGNHAQGVALTCKLLNIKCVVVMPLDSLPNKVEATRSYGAEVVFTGPTSDDRERSTQELIAEHDYAFVHPFNDDKIIAGQGTVALEIFNDLKELDYLFVPIGGGGLIGGCSLAAKNLFPGVRVIGVETEGANDCYQSFREGRIVKLSSVKTIADGIRTLSVGERNFELIKSFVDDVVTIKDDDIFPMMKFFFERMKIVVEPTGAVAGAAVMQNVLNLQGKKVCAVISGGNIDPQMLKTMI